jgi:hypothetical protein
MGKEGPYRNRMWPVAFAVTELTAAEEAKFAALVQRAVG